MYPLHKTLGDLPVRSHKQKLGKRLCVLAFLLSSIALPNQGGGNIVDPIRFQATEFRFVGTLRGGRASAVTGVQGEPFRFFMGTSGGGVWETKDAGTTWSNVSDGFFGASSIGAIAIAPSDSSVIYVGTGESCIRGDVQTGVGLYKSSDGGKTWNHSGLPDSRPIARVRVHPEIRISSMWPCWATYMARVKTGVSIVQPMAARTGRDRCLSATAPVLSILPWIPGTPTHCTRRFTRSAGAPGA